MAPAKLWTKNFVLCTFVNFLLMLNYYLLITVMTQYTIETYGAGSGVAGLSASIFVIGTLAARLFAGSRLEQIGHKRLVLIGAVLVFAMSGVYMIVDQIAILFAIRLIHGAAYGLLATALGTVVTETVPESKRGEGIGYYMLSNTLGAAVGPFCAVFFHQHGGYDVIFFVCTFAAVIALISVFLLNFRVYEKTAPVCEDDGKEVPAASRFLAKGALPISIVCALIYFGYSSILSFLMSFAAEIQQETAAQYFFSVYALAMLVTRPFTGKIFDKKGQWYALMPGMLGFAAGMLVLSRTDSAVLLLIAAAFLGFGVGVTQSAGLAAAVEAVKGKHLALVNSTFYICLDLAVGVGPLLLGYLLRFTGYRGMYLSMAVLSLLCVILYHGIYRRQASDTAKAVKEELRREYVYKRRELNS